MLSVACGSEERGLRRLFDQQVERLVVGGWHSALGWTEKDLRIRVGMLADPPSGVLHEIGETTLEHLPFLIVIPHSILSVEKQMNLLVFGKKRGYASLNSGKLWNPERIGESKSPYLICEVDDGAGNVGRTTGEVAGEISRACRHGLVMEEAIALAVHAPESLVHHALALIGEHYQGEVDCESGAPVLRHQCVPEFWLGPDGPTQNYSRLGSQREDRGVPSCRRRLFLDR